MKTIKHIALILSIAMFAFDCKKDSGPSGTSGGTLTEQEKQAIIQTYQSIAATADTILKGANPLTALQAMLPTYRSASNVENAWVTDDALYVKFKKSGTVSWYVAPPGEIIPPYGRPTIVAPRALELAASAKSGSVNSVLLFNELSKDDEWSSSVQILSSLKKSFEAAGFTVELRNSGQADVNFFKTGLKQFGVIFILSHGEYQADQGGLTWMDTGEELVGTDDQNLAQLLTRFEADFNAGRISIGVHTEVHGTQTVTVSYYKVSNRFIETYYTANDFPGSLIYACNCQILKDRTNALLATAFQQKGAAAVVGWTEKNSISPHTGNLLFEFLLCGMNLGKAIAALPSEAKTDRSVGVRADLNFQPIASSNFRLTQERNVTLRLTRPLKDSTYTTRSLQLAGQLIEGDTIRHGIVELNGVATTMLVGSDYKSFAQPLVLKSGMNSIHLTGCVKYRDLRLASFDTMYTFTGNFAPLDLWTELRWNTDNTDVDFHLLRPGAIFPGEMWTASDCYYNNKTPSWGAFLDVDNTSGRGPEHITIPTASVQGVYRLFVHYYSSRGVSTTSAYVSVSVRNAPNQEFGPMGLTRSASRGGDVWEVCTIEFPSGTVTRVMNKTTLPGEEGPTSFAHNKKR